MTRALDAAAMFDDAPLAAWFARQGWTPAPFQRELWWRYARGESGLLHTPTGSGKTLAAFGGPLLEGVRERASAATASTRAAKNNARAPRTVRATGAQVRVLWITPLRALATDTTRALRSAIDAFELPWTVAMRTGDASARDRRLARDGRAEVIVITPESLALLLSYPESRAQFAGLRTIVVDEWHELLGNKRGVLLQLNLARLRAVAPTARTWGLSATLGNLEEARDALLPHQPHAALVAGVAPRTLELETLLPSEGKRFPWAGHLGLVQLPGVLQRVTQARTSVVFTNTRAQAELWYQALASVWPDTPQTIALHHGSLDPQLRAAAEQGLRDGSVRCVVATSSLDLGVDFPAVDQVLQIGSPKGIARLLQRSGRARHRPGEAGHVLCVPTHVLELAEYAGVRVAIARNDIESRPPPLGCVDVLAQHCVSCALAGGFDADALFAEVRATHAYAALDAATWQSVLDFLVHGGSVLENYPEYRRVVRGDDGIYRVDDRKIALRHRLSIGTITSDGAVGVRFLKGARLGSVEENFVGRLRAGDRFQFAGRLLELVRIENMTAYVRLAKRGDGAVPRWQGGRMPLSSALGREVEQVLAGAAAASPEMQALTPVLDTQTRVSHLPRDGALLAEFTHTRDGWYLFAYPFAGRTVNEGIAALASMRWGRRITNTFSYAANDYGFVIALARETALDEAMLRELLSVEHVVDDLACQVNLNELARRQFREIARVAGLLPPSLPGRAPRSMRQLQASSGLLYDVLRRYDPGHVLLAQAEREVFSQQLDLQALTQTLRNCAARRIDLQRTASLTPLSFPLWAERWRGEWSNEDWKVRVQRAAERLEAQHG